MRFYSPDSLDHGGRARCLWKIITGRVVLGLAYGHVLHDAIHYVHGPPFASPIEALRARTGMREFHPTRLCKVPKRIAQHSHHGPVRLLVQCPRTHYCPIIATVNNDFADAEVLECVLILKVSRHLLRGSRRREGTGKTNDEDFLSGCILCGIDLDRGEAVMKVGHRHLVARFDGCGKS